LPGFKETAELIAVLQPFGMPSIGKKLLPSIGMPKSLYTILCDIQTAP
jgi:hypothetical protein